MIILFASVPFVIIGLIIWIIVTLRAANRDDDTGAAQQRAERDEEDESHVIHTGRGVLGMIAIVAGVAFVLMLIIFGTCQIRW